MQCHACMPYMHMRMAVHICMRVSMWPSCLLLCQNARSPMFFARPSFFSACIFVYNPCFDMFVIVMHSFSRTCSPSLYSARWPGCGAAASCLGPTVCL